MAGLEVLGALSSAVQLVDACLKVTAFISDLNDAPEKVRNRIPQIQRLIEIATLIQHNSSLQTPLIGSVLAKCLDDADSLLDILKKLDVEVPRGKFVKYWKALVSVTKEKRILDICLRLEEGKSSLALCIGSINSDSLREINMEMITARQGVDDVVKELPAIRDTARKITTIFDELPITATKVSGLHDELPTISGKITEIYDDMPAMAGKVTLIYDELPAIRDALERLALQQKAHIPATASTSQGQGLFLMPFARDSDFIGREDIISKIDQMFSKSNYLRRVALEGLGGVGKSQIAIEYAYRMRETSPDTQIFWIHAGDSNRFKQSYRSIANIAKLPEADDPNTDILGLVYRWLENDIHRNWLIILDNADDADVFFTQHDSRMPQKRDSTGRASSLSVYLPQSSGGMVLITTRNRAAGSQLTGKADRVIKVGHLEEEEANELLMKKLPHDQSLENDRNELVNALERLPLAITQAAAYIAVKTPRMTISKYLVSFRRSESNQILLLSKDGGDLRRDPEVPNAVVITWQISFDQIKLQNAPAADLLSRMCVFDRQEIPRFLIREDDEDDLVFEDVIGTLIEFSFVAALEDEDNFEMHPLVQLSTRRWLEIHGEMEQRKEEALSLLAQKYPPGEPANWKICEALEPHVQAVLKYHYTTKHHRLERAEVLYNSASYAWDRGDYGKAKERIEEAAETRKELLNTDDPKILSSLGLLALVLDNQGRWTEAEKLKVQVMEMKMKVLGQEHSDTLISMTNLASTYWNQGRWTEAEKLNVQVMETRKRILGQEDLNTLTSMANLASIYQNQGRWMEAEKLELEVMEIRKKVLGQEHPHTLMTMANLASTYQTQGRSMESEKLGVQVIEARKKVLGQEHPHTLTSMANLVLTYMNQGRSTEAEKLGVQVMETRKRVLGQEHPDTLKSMANLTMTYQNQGRLVEAEKMGVQIIETRKRVLGQEHPDTLMSMANLASTYQNQGRSREAEKLKIQVIEARTRVLGEEHPHTLTSMANLALTYWNQGRSTEAEKLGVQVMETRKRVLGQEHPETLTSMVNVACTWKSQGRDEEATELLKQAERLQKEKLGSGHYLTIHSTRILHGWQTSPEKTASPSTTGDI